MGHTTQILPPSCRHRSELEVRRRGPARALRVEVRHEPIAAAREAELERLAALERLEMLRRKLEQIRRLRASRGDWLEPLC